MISKSIIFIRKCGGISGFIMNRNENEVLKVLKMIYIQTFAL